MASVRIQGDKEKELGIYYEYNPSEAPLGEGGMGKVFRGWMCSESTNQRREVAIKFLYSDLPPHVIARARREAAVQLRNDSLIEMLGFVEISGKDEIGQPVVRYHVVSEYLHGVTLDKLLDGKVTDHTGKVIPFAQELYGKYLNNPYSFALTIVRNLLSGLIALHDAGYIHRDIDPSNIMVTSDGKIKLIDFGIAKRINGNNTRESTYTIDGQFIGKPKYAAPELVRGLVDAQNPTTDIYAVGILLYQLLVGKVPFEGEMTEVLEMQLNKKLPLYQVKQKQIKEAINTATQKKQANRYQSAAEFRVAVDRLVPLQYPAKTVDVRKAGVIAGAAVLLMGVVFGVASLFSGSGKDQDDSMTAVAEAVAEGDKQDAGETGLPADAAYDNALVLLSDSATASDGVAMLKTLAASGDAVSTFMLSRLYFNSPEHVSIGAFGDSVEMFRRNAGLQALNREAHRLLKVSVGLDPSNYKALYELGCDYKSRQRGAAYNQDSAYIYLDKARTLASRAGDSEYLEAIRDRIENLTPVAQ